MDRWLLTMNIEAKGGRVPAPFEDVMAISLATYGYVVKRGRATVAGDPNSKLNSDAMNSIVQLSNLIDHLEPKLRQRGFTADDGGQGCLRGIAFEIDEQRRPALIDLTDAMKIRGAVQGTLIVPTIGHLLRSGSDQTIRERDALRKIADSAIAVLTLDDPIVRRLLTLQPHEVSENDIVNLVKAGADQRQRLKRGITAQNSSKTKPHVVDDGDGFYHRLNLLDLQEKLNLRSDREEQLVQNAQRSVKNRLIESLKDLIEIVPQLQVSEPPSFRKLHLNQLSSMLNILHNAVVSGEADKAIEDVARRNVHKQ